MNEQINTAILTAEDYDGDLRALAAAKHTWAQTPAMERVRLLERTIDAVAATAQDWAETSARHKQIPDGSHLVGEEWLSGPYGVLTACRGLIRTLTQLDGKAFLDDLPKRRLGNGQLAINVFPASPWDKLLMSGITAEVWMQPHVKADTLKDHAAVSYDTPIANRRGKVALVLGAGNINAIPPLDAFQKLFLENQVVLLKLNPVNDYLAPILKAALKPLVDVDALRIVTGDGTAGAMLTNHDLVEEIHITGAAATHDRIVWGTGAQAAQNKAAGTPINPRHMTSELGAVCPTIVVPGPWSAADIQYQAQQIATQKMHNSGFNCVACQTLIMPKGWDRGARLLSAIEDVIATYGQRGLYYPGAADRVADFAAKDDGARMISRTTGGDVAVATFRDDMGAEEVFGPALAVAEIDADSAEAYLRAAIAFVNDTLFGTLGANIVIHPKTMRAMGKPRFEAILADLRYGAIAVNGWTGIIFLLSGCPWGGFPGATLDNVGSGIGTVHNTFMLEATERTVLYAPWAPFPRTLLGGSFSMLPKPPWFISHTRQHHMGALLTRFEHRPSVAKLPKLMWAALRG